MQYYSTQKQVPLTDLKTAILKGLADDNGLYMPQEIRPMPTDFFDQIRSLSFQEMSFRVAEHLFGEDIDPVALKEIVFDTLNFDIPLVKVDGNRYSLELFHGPTMAFKDVGARFLARIMRYYTQGTNLQTNVLVATSGDTGSAVANGFLGVEGITVTVLYPKGLVSSIQESQFTTLGQNIKAIEVKGTFDDCQRLENSLSGSRSQRKNELEFCQFYQSGPLHSPVFLLFLGLRSKS
jgi:threonine synthase